LEKVFIGKFRFWGKGQKFSDRFVEKGIMHDVPELKIFYQIFALKQFPAI
jgi:hypothetical protein